MESKPKLEINNHGDKCWKLPNGLFHHEDGPAVEYSNGYKEWWVNGKQYSKEDYKYKMRLVKLEYIL